ncbi:MAG: DUF3299 domain-containing protein [Leadbetterella sp.]|nr:DUF3299 domain-containing protein [Leadbetterella sp.]
MKLLCILFFSLWLADTPAITWDDLKDVKFTRKFVKEEDMHFLFPTFGEKVKKLNGKELQIRGYMIPVDPEDKIYVLSARPMASCFFCGGAGPETIIQLNLKNKKKFGTDEIWTVRGKFRLNTDDINECNYLLDACEPVLKH